MVITQTLNTEEYIYLKQLICMIAAKRLEFAIELDGHNVDYDNLIVEARHSLNNLIENQQYPKNCLRANQSVVNFKEVVNEAIDCWTHTKENKYDKIVNRFDIYKRPIPTVIYEGVYDIFKSNNKYFSDQDGHIQSLMTMRERFFELTKEFINRYDSQYCYQQAIIAINVIAAIEIYIEYAEVGEKAFFGEKEYDPNYEPKTDSIEDFEGAESRLRFKANYSENGLEKPITQLEGLEHLLNPINGTEGYLDIVGQEDFWDKVKDMSKKIYEGITKAVNEIVKYYTGDGTRAIEDAEKNLKTAIETMKKLNASVPIPENSPLIKKEKYFKAPKVEGLDETDLTIANKAISDINSAVDKVTSAKTVGELVSALEGIGNASIASSKTITEQIKKDASEASQAANKINNPSIPSSNEEPDVKKAKQEEIQVGINVAKEKGNGVKKIASIRNKFLAPALVVVGCVGQVEKLKENKQFKG